MACTAVWEVDVTEVSKEVAASAVVVLAEAGEVPSRMIFGRDRP